MWWPAMKTPGKPPPAGKIMIQPKPDVDLKAAWLQVKAAVQL